MSDSLETGAVRPGVSVNGVEYISVPECERIAAAARQHGAAEEREKYEHKAALWDAFMHEAHILFGEEGEVWAARYLGSTGEEDQIVAEFENGIQENHSAIEVIPRLILARELIDLALLDPMPDTPEGQRLVLLATVAARGTEPPMPTEPNATPTKPTTGAPEVVWVLVDNRGFTSREYTEQNALQSAKRLDRERPEYGPHTVNRYIHDSVIACAQAERDELEDALSDRQKLGIITAGIEALLARMKVVP